MEKIIEFGKKNYKILIPFMVLFVLLITIYFLYKEYKYDNYRNKQEVPVFQYFGGVKHEYNAIVTYNLKNTIVDLKSKDKKINYDAIPVYYVDEEKILFPREMNIVFPLREGSQFKLYKYSIYIKNGNFHEINTGIDTSRYSNFFLYDGTGVFFFPDSVELKINDKVYKELGAMSYLSLVGGYTLTYYDRATDTSEVIELDNDIVTVTSQYINVNLTEKYCLSFDKKVLLFNPKELNAVYKTD